ncbi:aldose 1-epimerase family protein [Geothrix fermentans]|uniref:aldose 1-epimerase family protein n=1 Tax=Geothrix fermentans TaxID=44676 RepID=UPI00040495AE|nr:aldose 1-epimerase family protein [Geothrix fermentans]
MDIHRLHTGSAEAVISARGAELQSLRLGGQDLLWDAGPLWPRHAPLLFPIVGRLGDDTLRLGEQALPMSRHGFARDRDFTLIEGTATTCTAELRDDEATRAAYPFPFVLRVAYTLSSGSLRMDLALNNPGKAPLPASLGLHPAFRWPLAPDRPKAAHRLTFGAGEPGPLRRLTAEGLLDPNPRPSPIQDRVLPLDEGLFSEDALIFLEPRSRSLRFETEDGSALTLRWEGFPHLGIWAKPDPGPSFLCIEPWEGHADPADWQGDFTDKPGAFLLAPGVTRRWNLTISLDGSQLPAVSSQ